jgi:hypothetical protein
MSGWQLPAKPRHSPHLTSTGIIQYRSGGDRVVVQLSASAQRDIFRLSAESCFLETGGGLCAASTAMPGDALAIVRAGGPGRTFKRRRNSIDFDPFELDEVGFSGFWHSHPRGGGRLSTPDLECFQRMRHAGIRPISRLVALIATPDPSDPNGGARAWKAPKTPQLAAWIVGDGYFQRAALTVTPDPPPRAKAPKSARSRNQMLVATRTFKTTDAGLPVTIAAGERISGDHPIVQRHPDAFKVDTSRSRHAAGSDTVTRVVNWREPA